jgi:hypothetical protein
MATKARKIGRDPARMDPKVKKMWCEELRSGKLKQGRGRLRNAKNEFCCLGVLCNLHAQAHPEIAAKQTNPGQYMGSSGYLPDAVVKWAKLSRENPPIRLPNGDISDLACLNDGDGRWFTRYTFAQLADLIEAQL